MAPSLLDQRNHLRRVPPVHRRTAHAVLAGWVMDFGFPDYDIWPLALLGLGLMLWSIRGALAQRIPARRCDRGILVLWHPDLVADGVSGLDSMDCPDLGASVLLQPRDGAGRGLPGTTGLGIGRGSLGASW